MKSILTSLFLAAAVSLAHAGAPAAKNPKNPVAPAPAPGCDPMSYSYAELGWLHLDNNLGTADGGYLDLSYDVGHNLFLEGTASVLGGDFDFEEYGAGIGYYIPVTSKFHLVARTGWAYTDTAPGDPFHEWYISPGFRLQVTCNLELYGKAYFHVPENGDENWSVGAGALYWVCNKAAISAGAAWGEDDDWSVQAGIRIKL